ncbi:MAG: hypothetical protein H0U76_03920 [Ktedonobacteraceae bacterium]|nr:hypothetical protein [Ktedonobacteraceae bacterium]
MEIVDRGQGKREWSMERNNLASLQYEGLQAEKRDKMNARLQIWSLFVGLVGAFGLASLQAGTVSYLVALYPFLAMCIARYASHNESVLDQVKEYLLKIEEKSNYSGYERYNRTSQRRSSGSHLKALRDAILTTQALATCMIAVRLLDNSIPLTVVIVVVELVVLIATWRLLRGPCLSLPTVWNTCRKRIHVTLHSENAREA